MSADLLKYGRQLLDEHGLHDWEITVENLRNKLMYGALFAPFGCKELYGLCDAKNKTIRVDSSLRRSFRQTVLHEIAHALTPDDNDHGLTWLNKAEEIGCTQTHLWPYFLRATAATP